MFPKALILAAVIAYVEARFGQEQVPIQAIAQVTSGGGPGVAATIAGGAISNLLGAANPCDKLKTADNIIAQLGTGADSVAAAIGFVASEQNFNPFASDRPVFCNDPTLPTTEILRGIVPLVDPAVTDSANANALSEQSKTTPFDATGLSVAQVFAAQGFTTFTTKDATGTVGPVGADLAGGATPPANDEATPPADDEAAPPAESAPPAETAPPATGEECAPAVTVTVTAGAQATAAPVETPPADEAPATEDPATQDPPATGGGSTVDGLDFGKCSPAIKFEGGLGGRPATEFTFQAIDPLVALGQQEALNPAIIVNRVCDQLTNVCEANQAAKDACLTAKAAVDPAQKNAQTAIDFNTALGFADAFSEAAPVTGDDGAATQPDLNPDVPKSTVAGLDFGKCVPTMNFLPGRNGRAATEFTFLPTDALVAQGQQEALNPAIIVNRICDQLTNVCEANQAAKDACLTAKAAVDPAQKNAQTAIDFNTALGFADVDVNVRRSVESFFRKRAIEGVKRRSARR